MEHRKTQRLDLNLLKVFEALYRERNMTGAARRLFLTPSAVSHAVKRLRQALGDPLFERKGQIMIPTPLCERTAPRLIEALHQLEQVLQGAQEFDPETTQQTFSIAMPAVMESLFASKLLGNLLPLLPNARITFVNLSRSRLERQLVLGEVDLAIDVSRPVQAPIVHQRLVSGAFAVLARKGVFGSTLTQKDYLEAEHVAVSNRPTGIVWEDYELLQRGYNRNLRFRCLTYQTARDLVSQSDYLLTLPNVLAEQVMTDNVERFSLPIDVPDYEIRIYRHETSGEDQSIVWLREQIMKVYPSNRGSGANSGDQRLLPRARPAQ